QGVEDPLHPCSMPGVKPDVIGILGAVHSLSSIEYSSMDGHVVRLDRRLIIDGDEPSILFRNSLPPGPIEPSTTVKSSIVKNPAERLAGEIDWLAITGFCHMCYNFASTD